VKPALARAPEPAPSDRLRHLARRVERLGTFGRSDPERTLLEEAIARTLLEEAIARALRRMARELKAGSP
jgi:hypothetical protein